MANRAVLTVAAIFTATLAQADTFAERWPAPSAVDPVQVAQAPPEKVRQAFACHRIFHPEQASVLGTQAMRRPVRAAPHCSRRLRTFSIMVSNPAKNSAA